MRALTRGLLVLLMAVALLGLSTPALGWELDLDIDDVAEEKEEDPGGYAIVNEDDDDTDNILDKDEEEAVSGEDELVELWLYKSAQTEGTITLTAMEGCNKIKVWQYADKSGELYISPADSDCEWPAASMPECVFLEGIHPSPEDMDVEFKLEWDWSGGHLEDTVNATIVRIDAIPCAPGCYLEYDYPCKPCTEAPLDPVMGVPIVNLGGPGMGLWQVNLNYGGYRHRWMMTSGIHLQKIDDERVLFWPRAYLAIDFHLDGGVWVPHGNAGPEVMSPYTMTGSMGSDGEMTVVYHTAHSETTYTLYGPNYDDEDLRGKLESIDFGEQTVEYTWNASTGKLTSVEDEFGRTITYTMDDDGNVTQIVEPGAGGGSGRKTTFEWDSGEGKLTKMTVNMPTGGGYASRTWEMVYDDDGRLTQIIAPEHAAGDIWSATATCQYEYDDSDDDEIGKLTEQTVSGCGYPTVVLGMRYTFQDENLATLYTGAAPAAPNKPYYQLNVYRPEGMSTALRKIIQINTNHQAVFVLERATDSTGWLKEYQYSYDSASPGTDFDFQLVAVLEYEVNFTWSSTTGSATGHSKTAERQYDYNANLLRDEMKVWDGTSTNTVKEWTYTSRQIASEKAYDGTSVHETKYYYNDGRVGLISYPQISENLPNGYSSYYPGQVTAYDSDGRVTETKSVRHEMRPTVWNDTPTETFRTTRYAYVSTNDFSIDTVTVENGDDDLVTDYNWKVVGGIRRKIAEIVDPGGLALTTCYAYNDQDGIWGNPTGVQMPDEIGRIVNDYDEGDHLITSVRYNGNYSEKTVYTYNRYGQLVAVTQAADTPEANTTVTEFDSTGRQCATYGDVKDFVWLNGYWSGTPTGNIAKTCYIPGTGRTDHLYTKAGVMGWGYRPAYYTYYANGLTKTVKKYDGKGTEFVYREDGFLTTEIDMFGNHTVHTGDRLGRRTETKRYDGAATGTPLTHTKTVYEGLDLVIESTVKNPAAAYEATTEYYHHGDGQLAKVEDPEDKTIEVACDAAGRQDEITDPEGNKTYTTYDPAGRVVIQVARQEVDDDPLTYRYDLVINYYDDLGRPTTIANWGTNKPGTWAAWSSISLPIEYGDANAPIPEAPIASDANTLVTRYAYESTATEECVKVTDPADRQTWTYTDHRGRTVKTISDQGGIKRTTTYAHDLLFKGLPYKSTVTVSNEGFGADQVTAYYRGSQADVNRIWAVVYPDGSSTRTSYNFDGTVEYHKDRRRWRTTYTYDEADRVIQEDVTGTSASPVIGTTKVTYAYDALGRVTEICDNNGTSTDNYTQLSYTYGWDATSAKQKVTETQHLHGESDVNVEVMYQLNGVRDYLKYPSGSWQLDYTHDGLGRVTDLEYNSAKIAQYTYKGGYLAQKLYGPGTDTGVVKHTLEPGATALDGYDNFGRITHQLAEVVSGGADRVNLQYQYDTASNPTGRYDALNNSGTRQWSQMYSYDTLHRLAQAKIGAIDTDGGWSITAANTWNWNDADENGRMDKLGNWVKHDDAGTDEHRSHDVANKITSRNQGTENHNLVYDAEGNVTDDGDAHCYAYDYRNRVVDGRERCLSPLRAAYIYDGKNRRVRVTTYTGTLGSETTDSNTRYIYDGWQCIEERDPDEDELRARYVWGGTYVDELVQQERDTDDDGTLDLLLYSLQDSNYNVVALLGSDGAMLERCWYKPYGEVICYNEDTEATQATSFFENPYLFQGRRLDAKTGLYHFRNRQYSATHGRFLQRDPKGYEDGPNLYQAFGGRPVGSLDPFGREYIKWEDPEERKWRETAFWTVLAPEREKPRTATPAADPDRVQLLDDIESIPSNRPLSYDELWTLAYALRPAGAHYRPSALLCIILRENTANLRPDAVSSAGARGLTQVMKATAEDMTANNLRRMRNPSRLDGKFRIAGLDTARPLYDQLNKPYIAVQAAAWILEDKIMTEGGDLERGLDRYSGRAKGYAKAVMGSIRHVEDMLAKKGYLSRSRLEEIRKRIHSKEWEEGKWDLE